MKPTRILILSVMLLGSAVAGFGAPASKTSYTASARRTEADFRAFKAGDKIALVCKECESVTVQTVDSPEAAMKLCKEGDSVTCSACKKTYKVFKRGPRSQNTMAETEVHYQNEKGEDCMFVVKLEP